MVRIVGLALVIAVSALALSRLNTPPRPALACVIDNVPLEYAAREADAAAIVLVESAGGPENSAPPVTPVPPRNPNDQRTAPVDLRGYGATVRMYEPIFGALPSQFEVDMELRRQIEEQARKAEGGFVPPCVPGYGTARYLPG